MKQLKPDGDIIKAGFPRKEVEEVRVDGTHGLNLWRNLLANQNRAQLLINQLSTATRLTSARVDAAGVSIAQQLRAQVEGYQKSLGNIYDGIGALRTAEGGMESITNNLQRLRELAVQSANSTLTAQDRAAIQEEARAILEGINQIVNTTQYNETRLLTGEFQNVELQTGPSPSNKLTVSIPNLSPEALGLNELDLQTREGAQNAIEKVDQALRTVASTRGTAGAFVNRLERSAESVANALTNVTASLSIIEDMDMARGIVELVRLDLLRESNLAITAQASNLSRNNILRLLGS
ncbi:MAG: flagellin [Thermotogae bacterium]|nr:MAG: flagellin [Thermotogota bacterium]